MEKTGMWASHFLGVIGSITELRSKGLFAITTTALLRISSLALFAPGTS
jgi:hypothetical protein